MGKTKRKKEHPGTKNLIPYKKGDERHPNANKTFKPEDAGRSFSKQFIRDMAWAYRKLGGKKFVLAHIKNDPKFSEKFIDKLVKIASNEQQREIKMDVSGHISHDQTVRYGLNLETVAGLMQQMRAGEINIDSLMDSKVPALPEGEEHILADVVDITPEPVKVEVKKIMTLEDEWDNEKTDM